MPIKIFPAPRRITFRKNTCTLRGRRWVVLPPGSSPALHERVAEHAAEAGHALGCTLRLSRSRPAADDLLLEIAIDKKLPTQGFALAIDDAGAHLIAADEAAVCYGMTAFVQIVQQRGTTVPVLRITDHPDHQVRGVMLDVSRCKVPTMTTLKLLIDRWSRLRYNQLQLYIEHTFAFVAHETVWRESSPFTHEEILELDAYCAARHIELVPNFNSFGHFQRWLKHPEYKDLAECPDGYDNLEHGTTLAPRRQSLELLDGLYDELLPNFNSRLLNVGCDETWELGQGWSKKKAEAQGSTRVYLDFLKKIHRLVQGKGRRMMFWGDIILHQPKLIPELPKDLIALAWGYEADEPMKQRCRGFARSGLDFYVCPGVCSWNSITGRTTTALANLTNAAAAGTSNGALGYLNTDWGDNGHHQVLSISYAGYAAGAAYSWCLKSNAAVDIAYGIDQTFFGAAGSGFGQVLLDLGRTIDQIPGTATFNSTMINHWIFDPAAAPDAGPIRVADMRRGLRWLNDLADQLGDCRATAVDADLVLDELQHAIGMAVFGVQRGLALRGKGPGAQELQATLRRVIMRHDEIWQRRNRLGGLHESSARLRAVPSV